MAETLQIHNIITTLYEVPWLASACKEGHLRSSSTSKAGKVAIYNLYDLKPPQKVNELQFYHHDDFHN